MVPLAQLEAVTEIAQVAVAALVAMAAAGRGSTRPADLGQLAWPAWPSGWLAARSCYLPSCQLPPCAGKVSFSSATNSANVFGLRPPSFSMVSVTS